MDIDRYKRYAPLVLRIGLSLVFLWFGINQLITLYCKHAHKDGVSWSIGT